MITFKSWWKATKEYSTSTLGSLNTTFIITLFIAFGSILGSLQMKFSNNYVGALPFMLFAFGLLNLYNLVLLNKQIKIIKKQQKLFKNENG